MDSAVTDNPDIVYGRRVLVPIGTAVSAHLVLDMAFSLMKQEDGQIIVLGNPPTGSEDAATEYANIAKVVQRYRRDGFPIKLRTKVMGTMTRSILEAVREWGIDLLLLPLYRSGNYGGATAKNIVANVIATTPCNVLIYRPSETEKFNRIVVPVLEESESAEAMADEFSVFLRQRLDTAVDLLPYQTTTEQKTNPDETLLAIAVNGQDSWESWQALETEDERILGKSTALLVLFLPEGKSKAFSLPEKAKNWLNPKIAPYEEAELVAVQEESGVVSLDYIVLIVIAAILASLGLILNSNAVIIGAMLVAPLMAPLIAFSTGMAIGDLRLSRNSIVALLVGIFLALSVSYFGGLISATTIITSEMAGRGNPTFLDLAVALASGVIGAYAAGRKSISSAAAGVAIAAALMPPLCTVGLAYAFGDIALSRGAFLLFLTNIISIILAATITFFWLGLRSYETDEKTKKERQRTSNILVFLFVVVLAALWFRQVQSANSGRIETVLRDSFQQAELVGVVIREEEPLQIIAKIQQPITLLNDSSEIVDAKQNLEESLQEPVNLQVVIEPVADAAAIELRVELEQVIEETLIQEMPNIHVIEFVFALGNPSLVIAGVATDLDEDSEAYRAEVDAAKDALENIFDFPTELIAVVIGTSAEDVEAIESTDAYIEGTISNTLAASLPSSQIKQFTYQFGNPTVVNVSVKTDLNQDDDTFTAEVQGAEMALEEAIGVPVRLSVQIDNDE